MLSTGDGKKANICPCRLIDAAGFLGVGNTHNRIPVAVQEQHLTGIPCNLLKSIHIHYIRGNLPAKRLESVFRSFFAIFLIILLS